MTDRNDNLGGSNRSDESIDNPDLGRDRSGGMSGSGSERGSQRDRGPTETTGDEIDDDSEIGRSGSPRDNNGGNGSERGSQGDGQSGQRGDQQSGRTGGTEGSSSNR